METEKGVATPEELAGLIETNALLCGEACEMMAGIVDQSRLKARDVPKRDPHTLIDIAQRMFADDQATSYEQLRPIYARPPSISQPKRPK